MNSYHDNGYNFHRKFQISQILHKISYNTFVMQPDIIILVFIAYGELRLKETLLIYKLPGLALAEMTLKMPAFGQVNKLYSAKKEAVKSERIRLDLFA